MTGFETVASQGTSRDTAAPEILTVTRFFPFKTIGNTASLNRCTVFCSMRQVIFSAYDPAQSQQPKLSVTKIAAIVLLKKSIHVTKTESPATKHTTQ